MEKENVNVNKINCHAELDSASLMRFRIQSGMTEESGRSMVEMLGVLAIIGVLTVVGITGFRYAMNKHYANQTVNRLMKRAVVVAAQANFGQTLSLHEFDENDGEYKITLLDPTNNESFTMQVEDIPQEVCQQILGMDWKLAKMNPDNCSEETINFMFLNDLTDCASCQPDSIDCPPESEMQCGTCSVVKGFVDNNADCEGNENGEYCVRGKCTTCDKDYYFRDTCKICQKDASTPFTSASTKHNCLGSMFFRDKNNRWMEGCETAGMIFGDADGISCKACSNRCFNPSNNYCYLADEKRTGLKRKPDGTCSDCAKGFYTRDNQCNTCTKSVATYYISESEKHNCLGSMYYSDPWGWMIGCEVANERSGSDEESCKACKNSEGVKNRCYLNGTCYLAGEGQAHQRVSETDGTCQQ